MYDCNTRLTSQTQDFVSALTHFSLATTATSYWLPACLKPFRRGHSEISANYLCSLFCRVPRYFIMPYAKHLLRVPRCSPTVRLSGLITTLVASQGERSVRPVTRASLRGYASKPKKFSPRQIYSSFVRKSLDVDRWETVDTMNEELEHSDHSRVEQVKNNARKLKESLAVPPGKDFLDYYLIKSNLIALLMILPPSVPNQPAGYTKYKNLLETSLQLLLKESESPSKFNLSIQDICQIYFILIRNGVNALTNSNLIPQVFSIIQASKMLTPQQQLESSLEFLKFLDAQQNVSKAEQLLSWILDAYGPLDAKSFESALQAVSSPHIKFKCIPILFSAFTSQGNTPSHESLVFALDSLNNLIFLREPSLQTAFSSFVTANFISVKSQHSNVHALITILSAFLSIRDQCGASKFLELFDNSIDINSLKFSSDQVQARFLKLLAVSHMKYSANEEVVSELLAKLEALGRKDLDLMLFWELYSEKRPGNLARIFDTKIEEGLQLTEELLNDCVEILIRKNFELLELKELLLSLSHHHGIETNVETYEILMNFSLINGNVELAIQIFQDSLNEGSQWESSEGVHLKSLDNLIVAVCDSKSSDVFLVFKIYQQIRNFTKTVGYEAQASLLKLFLSYNYVGDCEKFLEDELGTESRTLPREAQPKIYDLLFSYAINCQNYKDSWLIYGLSQKYFDAPYDNYLRIMKHFCDLVRPDAALIIFKNMRNRSKATGSKPPDEAIYSLLFKEFGQCGYSQGVFELHTMFKMDTSVEADTLVLNEIMHAYCELDNTQQTLEIWSQIESSPEGLGPNNDSYSIMLKLCTKVSIQDVEMMWHKLLESGLEPDDANYRQYIIANCYHGFYVRALDIAKAMPTKGIEPSKETLGALYNWTLLQNRKEDVTSWAKTSYPNDWAQLEEEGTLKTYLLEENNPRNDNEAHLRIEVNSKLALEGKKLVPEIL